MSRKFYRLFVGVSGGVCAIASAVVAYCEPSYTPAIIGAIGIAETAIAEIASLFLDE